MPRAVQELNAGRAKRLEVKMSSLEACAFATPLLIPVDIFRTPLGEGALRTLAFIICRTLAFARD